MGDTQKSQTISTENQGIASQEACDTRLVSECPVNDKPPVLVGESSLVRIRMLAEANPDLVFRSLAHRIDLSLLQKIISSTTQKRVHRSGQDNGKRIRRKY